METGAVLREAVDEPETLLRRGRSRVSPLERSRGDGGGSIGASAWTMPGS